MNPTVTFHVGDVLEVLRSMPEKSVNSVITSPPYWRKRAYLPAGHAEQSKEIGQENTPGEFLASLLAITDELWRVVRDDGTIWINLGDTSSGSGGSGGDYNPGGLREGQAKWQGSGRAAGEHGAVMPWKGSRPGHPRAKSVCWIPELFGASLAYGKNLLTGEPCKQWVTRPPVTWCKPNPPVGEIIDKFREATELIVWASKQERYYFDLDAVRQPTKQDWGNRVINSGAFNGHPRASEHQPRPDRACNPKGVPPLNYWIVNTSDGVADASGNNHYATFPGELIHKPVIVSCPEGGTILDPFCGSGTTLAVAHGNGRSAIGIDINEASVELVRQRVGSLFAPEIIRHCSTCAGKGLVDGVVYPGMSVGLVACPKCDDGALLNQPPDPHDFKKEAV